MKQEAFPVRSSMESYLSDLQHFFENRRVLPVSADKVVSTGFCDHCVVDPL